MSRFSAMCVAGATRSMSFWCALLAACSLVGPLPSARSAISPIGSVSPDPSTWDAGTTGFIGKTAAGALTVDGDSDLFSCYGYIGFYSGTSGLVTVSGSGSTWTNSNDLYVSYNGGGTLSIASGGAVSTNSSYIGGVSGLVKVDGAGSSFANSSGLFAGYSGDGTLSVTNGGSASSAYGYLGYGNGARGTVAVDGSGSTWNNGGTWVGYSSSGTLSITNGGTVNCYGGHVGYNAGSTGTVTVDGAGSTWNNGGWLAVGEYGSGTLSITNGGNVINNGSGYVGSNTGSTGVVTVDGLGSTWNNNYCSLFVGGSGNGTLSVTRGGNVISYGGGIGATGTVNVDGLGSTWNNYGDLSVGSDSGSGSLSITGGGVVTSSGGHIGDYANSTGTVTVDGAGSTWNNTGNLFDGTYSGQTGGIGTLNITAGGNVSTSSGSYIGYGSGSVGNVKVDGAGSTWTNSSGLYVGGNDSSAYYGGGAGTLSITGGGTVTSAGGYIGFARTNGDGRFAIASTGAVTVDGAGSTWTNNGELYIGGTDYLYGSGGTGVLSITNGSSVSVAGTTYVGLGNGSAGTIDFGAKGGTLTTQSLFASPTQLLGAGTINTRGLVSNVDLVFDANHGLKQTIPLNSLENQNIAVNLDMASDPSSNGELGAGYHGTGSLTIRDGIAVNSTSGYLGCFSGSKGVATVTGAGSSWTNTGSLYVGGIGGDGTLSITGGGAVSSVGGYLGYGTGSTGKVTVDGIGSIWTDNSGLYVGSDYSGYGAGSGTLSISNGGAVTSWGGSIGTVSSASGAVTVDGAGSTWTNNGGISVGGAGGSGTLSITRGGTVSSWGGSISSYGSGLSSMVTVDGAGSTWNNGYSWLWVGGNGGAGTLSITNGGSVYASYGAFIGYGSGSTGTVTVDGIGSTWSNYGDVYVGGYGSGGGTGTLAITHGGSVSNSCGYIGANGSTGNVTVDGTGSAWTNSSDLYVGDYSDNSGGAGTLAITNGGNVSVAGATYVGSGNNSMGAINFGANGGTLTTRSLFASPTQLSGAGAINTRGLVSDVDLVFDSTSSLSQTLKLNSQGQNVAVNLDMTGGASANGALGAGYLGSGSLAIRNGVAVTSNAGYLGYHGGSMGMATVDGPGSTWTNSNNLYVGYSGSGTLSVTGGGAVNSSSGYIGYNSGSMGIVTVDGVGSSWTNSSSLVVGYSGNGTLSITGGGDVSNPWGYVAYIGYNSGSMGAMKVDGAGSTWTNCSDLYVGVSGSGTLSITGGGDVSDTVGHIGSGGGSMGSVAVIGAGSTWTNGGCLYVGGDASYYSSPGNGTLNITDGGAVTNTIGYIGYGSGWGSDSTGIVTVDGPGSKWTNRSYLYVGGGNPSYYSGGSGTLNITDGGAVTNTIGYIGCSSGYSSGPTGIVTVDGAGSTWTNRSNLYVGGGTSGYYCGGNGTLNITNGGAVSDSIGYVGYGSSYNSGPTGTVTVDGAGSTWTNRGDLYVGDGTSADEVAGSGTLNISNGGAVSNANSYVGYASASGVVTVDGAGSTWTNRGNLYVGYSGMGTVTQTGGTNSVAGTLYLGHDSTGSGTYNLNGGVLAVSGLSAGAGTAAFNFGGGTLRANAAFTSALPMTLTGTGGNATVNTQSYAVSLSGSLSGDGGLTKSGSGRLILTGNNSYTGLTTVKTGGTIELGANAEGTVLAHGADVQNGATSVGSLVFDYSGATAEASLLNSIRADLHSGLFKDSLAGTLSNGAVVTLGYSDNGSSSITLEPMLAGDANHDGSVDIRDFTLLKSSWLVSSGATWANGDFNADGSVDIRDFTLLKTNWLKTWAPTLPAVSEDVGALGGVSPVPEPSSLMMLGSLISLGAMWVVSRRRRNPVA
jgi:T5SS/PEP-CTERM-associated repeat protein